MRPMFTLSLISLCTAALAEGVPEDFALTIEAETFARGTVKAAAGSGWADDGAIIQCDERSPDWAEWDFAIEEGGVYQIYAKFAAHQSRPVDVSVDGSSVRRRAMGETTGSWKSSTARWFPVGPAVLAAGSHILRIDRSTCIPHIDAFGFQRLPGVDLTKGPLDMPEELRINDGYPIQDWMIWTIGGTEQFGIQDGAFAITNGAHTLNRPLYGTNGPETIFAGDRPVIAFTRGPSTKLGALAAEICADGGRKWLEDADHIEFAYDGKSVSWRITDPLLGDATLRFEVCALDEAPGFIARATADAPVRLAWWYGGVRGEYKDNKAGHGALPGGRGQGDCQGNLAEVKEGVGHLSHPEVAGGEVYVACQGATLAPGEGPALRAEVEVGERPLFFAAAATEEDLARVMADVPKAWDEALSHYETIASRLTTQTPAPILDAAMRGNNAAMDGQFRAPSFLHGALRWGTECNGWFLGWRGWYGPIVAGDFERLQDAARMHFEHQYDDPAEGLDSAGKVAPFVGFDGAVKRHRYNMHEVFLDHLRSYYWWTGDHGLMKELWPNIKRALEYERREMGKDLDGLYTNAINTWISDGHHYNGHACTQASAYNVSLNRWAADVATLAGEDGAFYAQHAGDIIRKMKERLWLTHTGYYAEYVDADGAMHDAAEAATIYHAVEMGAADMFQAYQMTRYVDERLRRFGDQILANDWFPVIVTCGLIGFNESLNTALAYYYAGRFDDAWRLLEVCCESTAKATIPGSISCYGSREGEQGVYIDFTDASSMFARTAVEGLFGLQPRVDQGRVEWTPRFPGDWDHARLATRGFSVALSTEGSSRTYILESDAPLEHVFILPAEFAQLDALSVNGKAAQPEFIEGMLRPYLRITAPPSKRTEVRVTGSGALPTLEYPAAWPFENHVHITCKGGQITEFRDPQGFLRLIEQPNPRLVDAIISTWEGHHTAFAKLEGGAAPFWAPVNIEAIEPIEIRDPQICAIPGVDGIGLAFDFRVNNQWPEDVPSTITIADQAIDALVKPGRFEDQPIRVMLPKPERLTPGHTSFWFQGETFKTSARACLWSLFEAMPGRAEPFAAECALLDFDRNDTLAEIFSREYDLPNPPELNNWTWYKTDYINTEAMRRRAEGGVLTTHIGVPFAVSAEGHDGLYLSRWDPFPQSARVPVGARGDKLYLLLANHTHNSQTHLVQAEVILEYADGARETVPLRGPDDIDGMLQHYSSMAPEWIGGADGGWYGHGRASGVHADITDIELQTHKELAAFELRCVTEETLIGLLGATIHRITD